MFEPVAKESMRFEIEEEKIARILCKGLNELQEILLQKLPWKADTTINQLKERFVRIEYLLTAMVEGTLFDPKSIKLRKIRTKAFAHYESQIKVLGMLKQILGLLIGIQDSFTQLKGSAALSELNTFEVLEIIRNGAIIPVSKRIESELKDTIRNAVDFLDLESNTSNKRPPSHSHVDFEEPEPMLQAEVLLNSINEALRLDQRPEMERSVSQVPDDTDELLDTLRNLQKYRVKLQQSPSTKSAAVYDCSEQDMKRLRLHLDENSLTSSWAVELVKQGMPDKIVSLIHKIHLRLS
ncbi:hypothetical protein PTTG_28948 [Puccinia triticina 1-1 BBBD Race 1]|uniref:Uncharacterized protein n=2 Tax=Puccinia triticina TaxID=208348 RepID=A0A180G7M7_PUCT1|nr:hypothetical protein PTTG_28948 [Puccinia triticina 1-1 BBBD Race 1]